MQVMGYNTRRTRRPAVTLSMIHAIIAACNELSPGHSMYQAYGDTGVMHNGNMVAGPGCKRECLDSLNAHRYKLIAAKDKADARREHAQAREARS